MDKVVCVQVAAVCLCPKSNNCTVFTHPWPAKTRTEAAKVMRQPVPPPCSQLSKPVRRTAASTCKGNACSRPAAGTSPDPASGVFSALLAGTLSEDFIQAILTDENPLLDPMKGLRAAYPLHKRAAEMRVWIRSERLKLAMPFRDNRDSYMRECSGVVCCWARSETRKKKTIAANVAAPASDVVSLTEPSTAPTASGPTAMPSNCAAANSRATE